MNSKMTKSQTPEPEEAHNGSTEWDRFLSQKQVHDDISRRLALLQEQWAGGKLSIPVKKRMALLVQGMGGVLYPATDGWTDK